MVDGASGSRSGDEGAAAGARAKRHLLLAEDEPHIRRILTTLLEDVGFEVTAHANGSKALEALQGPLPFDLILLDLMMPGASGLEVLAALRRLPHRRSTPTVILSAKGEDVDRNEALALGAVDFITKPFSPKRFLARVDQILEHE